MADIVIEPKEGIAPAPEAAPKQATSGLSDELLQIPALQALFAGQPPALSTPMAEFEKRPEAKLIADHKDELMKAGVGLYRSIAGDLGVLFNQLHIAGADIQQADKEGRLLEVAPSFDQVNDAIAKSGDQNPVLTASVPGGPKTASTPAPASPAAPMPASGSGQPASVQNKTATARLKNLTPQGPLSGAAPGAGRVLNNILKSAV